MYAGQAPPPVFERIRRLLYGFHEWRPNRQPNLLVEDRRSERKRIARDPALEDLEQALSRIRDDSTSQNVDFRVVVTGRPKSLKPHIWEEIYCIGREALINALRHSKASEIEIDVEYASRRLRITVRDNGCGIDPRVVWRERDGHRGLTGMRERAESIGARLRIWSRQGAGSEIDVTVPGHVAFASHAIAFFPNISSPRPSVTLQQAG